MSAVNAKPVFTIVSPPARVAAEESLASRIQSLQAEARMLAHEQIVALETKLAEAGALAHEIAGGGEAYPVGVRELARRLADETPRTAQTLEAIMSRV
jgi:hypothetical protein